MRTQLFFIILCCGVLAACTRSDDSGSKSAADWAKAGETDGYVYYADHASIKKADEIVTMWDLFDYKTARTEGGAPPCPLKENRSRVRLPEPEKSGYQDNLVFRPDGRRQRGTLQWGS